MVPVALILHSAIGTPLQVAIGHPVEPKVLHIVVTLYELIGLRLVLIILEGVAVEGSEVVEVVWEVLALLLVVVLVEVTEPLLKALPIKIAQIGSIIGMLLVSTGPGVAVLVLVLEWVVVRGSHHIHLLIVVLLQVVLITLGYVDLLVHLHQVLLASDAHVVLRRILRYLLQFLLRRDAIVDPCTSVGVPRAATSCALRVGVREGDGAIVKIAIFLKELLFVVLEVTVALRGLVVA